MKLKVFFVVLALVLAVAAIPQGGYQNNPGSIGPSPRANNGISGRVIEQVESVFNGVMNIVKDFFRRSPV
ncbi:CLUMA_CG017628, isoform A [Clunio marinus]|uniref:CLUMA_CG017628, isoform A n=1 Tax=Clunio marinus TaxID=568069 RepID=A0A1J1IWG8_9DIPT|nr:CLUMA_CG017628, isoform A [Clunio marinus]